MKIALFCVVFVAVFALISAEECRSTGDCGHVTCPEKDYVLDCHNRQCTCTHVQQQCTTDTSTCHDDNCHRTWHCIDGRCRCGFGFGGGFPIGGVGK
ncbi:serine protease inhibitor Cvsi-2-like [Ruditapes philippinarum]|uniref:serine protease inhibitor Cvsi-2-like n=1 Tax=Ruditapes philippinarum TaxID=129788 RepID=UPI00295AA11E|nr:serine protease inhibitor Cvsi-2-like [Ruditapes philippinarum]